MLIGKAAVEIFCGLGAQYQYFVAQGHAALATQSIKTETYRCGTQVTQAIGIDPQTLKGGGFRSQKFDQCSADHSALALAVSPHRFGSEYCASRW